MSRGYRLPNARRGPLTVQDVIEHVAFEFHLAPDTILHGNGRRYLSQARYAIAWLAQRHTRATAETVGAALGRHRNAAFHFAQYGKREMVRDAEFRALVERIGGLLTACAGEAA